MTDRAATEGYTPPTVYVIGSLSEHTLGAIEIYNNTSPKYPNGDD